MYTVHIRIARGDEKEVRRKTESKESSSTTLAAEVCTPENKTRRSENVEDGKPKTGENHVLSQRIVQKFVAPQVTLQPPDVQTVRVLQAVQPRQLNRESNLPTMVLALVAIDGVGGGG